MLRYGLRRLTAVIPLLVLVSIVSFALVELTPGDAAVFLAGDDASPDDIARVRGALNLDDNVLSRYFRFLGRAAQGDLGSSLFTSQEVRTIIADRLPVTMSLVLVAVVLACVVGIPVGVVAALRRGSWLDRGLSITTAFALAAPSFLVAVFMLKWFAVDRSWFPATGFVPFGDGPLDWLKSLALPATALSLVPGAEVARTVRASFSNALERDYVDTARAKGLSSRQIVVKHTFKNAAVPIVTVLGVQIGRLIGGAVIIERLFNFPGLGTLMINSVLTRDVPVIQGVVLATAAFVVILNLFVDLSYGYFNPRVRH